MALTYTVDNTQLVGTKRMTQGTITYDSSYATGGETVDPHALGLQMLTDLRISPSTGGYIGVWDRSTTAPKLMAFYGDNNNASDGPLIEVPSTTDLSAVVVRYEAWGY